MNLIEEYILLTKTCAKTDYSDSKSVKANNKSVNRMYEIAEKIGYEQTNDSINDFIKLLDIYENKTNIWAATHLLERIPIDERIEKKALEIIENAAKGATSEAMGFRMWLNEYNKK